ncbi:DotU family type IV/VI secretion system protein [Desulfobacter vibrioformis]|uniref:DotU family type IV/VI secretion system protein n=1 Tax=Desulfobacter vibrioformis TaxID=34031 RepID=UPI00068ECC38|nr:DotU family type IV/VI secretion system protein [Desulfobacter vibrioformis]
MEKQLWEKIAEIFSDIDAGIESLLLGEQVDKDGILDNPDTNVPHIRDTVRKRLDLLRIDLAQTLTEQESYYVLFAIVIYIDEHIQVSVLDKAQLTWPILQRELFDIDDGGNLFYETLDHILKKPEISLFVFEVFFFCLKHGFKGKYIHDPVTISDYMKSLEQKINKGEFTPDIIIPESRRHFPFLFSPAWYYGIAALFLLLTMLVFSMV